MKKIHTRIKRRFNLSTHLGHYSYLHDLPRKHRPKTFKTEEAAHRWAEKSGLKREAYFLKKIKRNKKFQVVVNGKNKNLANKNNNP